MLRDKKSNWLIQYREFLAAPVDEANVQIAEVIATVRYGFGDKPIVFAPERHGLGRTPRFVGFLFANPARFRIS